MLPLLFLLFFFHSPTPANSLNAEGLALLSLKQSLTDPEGLLSNWNSSDKNPCSWNGVSCNFLRVVAINIPKSKLHGFLHPSLGSLSQLRYVNFRNNKLFGSLPIELFQAQKLQSLLLYGNSFSGSVPNEIGNLRYLQNLDLSQNFFNGSLPNALISCKRLQFLDLSENNFTGSLPYGFGSNLFSLELLDLSFNNFSGSIPSDLGKLSSLQGPFDLSHNHFSGSIPSSLGNLPEKVYIDLSFNNLSGPIPLDGALMNRGPTAFIGNPNLCGPPLKKLCSSETNSSTIPSSLPSIPDDHPPDNSFDKSQKRKANGLSKKYMIGIVVVSDIIGIFLLGLLFSYCYFSICGSVVQVKDRSSSSNGIEVVRDKGKKKCLCFRKDESETVSEIFEHSNNGNNNKNLVALDPKVGFDMDELLKASAFVLGKSGTGIVYKVVLEDGLTLAVRRLGEGGSQRCKEFQNEVEAIGKLRHPNVVSLRAYYWSVDEKLLIYDYVPYGNLASALHGKAGLVTFTPLSWSMRLKIIRGTAKGLVYIHEFSPKKYVHGDLKPSNILLGQNMEPYISNFGLGQLANIAGSVGSSTSKSNQVSAEKSQEKLKGLFSSVVTTTTTNNTLVNYGYQAPESLKSMKPSQKWDVYSFGVILLELITGRLPVFQVSNSEMDLVQQIQLCIEEKKKPLSDVLDPYLAEDADREEDNIVMALKIAMACVHGNPEKRPTMRHVIDSLERLSVSSD